ncbi:murein L,D-transpeptidase catalytic domain family protein [Blastomonas sp.]|uniref:murein L,D-transpeptidase catalytic domain family protein n=1 Tax=Blastomonas sp. TaxID=1909299 RepID=UPI0026388414|nr:murein L,D-transpeptidase catalytic domain family protein [Blastomonas sp.]MDM7956990.1 murein L,D-transpeptidase catalytic domain family protein [Blastomonas sp.]
MKLTRRHFIGALGLGAAGASAPAAFARVRTGAAPDLLAQAKAALDSQGAKVLKRDVVGVVDFSAPSGKPRFQIVDLDNGRVMSSMLVAHGRGSDPANTGFLQRFSNEPGSNASSSGSFVVGETYVGKYGRSARLHGLDPQNDMAFDRAIVIHCADYVSQAMASASGRVGRSFGCFTVPSSDIATVLALLGPGRLLFSARTVSS